MLFERAIEVLVVEDNPGDSRLIEIQLADELDMRFTVRVAPTLADALSILKTQAVDAVLLDLFLPDSRGIETLKAVRGITDDTPVVVLSGLDDAEVALKAVGQGAQDYLVKGKGDGEVLRRSILYAMERERIRRRMVLAEAAFGNADTGMIVTDSRGVVVRVNPAFLDVTGYAEDEVVGREAGVLRSDVHDEDFYKALWADLKAKGAWEGEVWNRRRNGEIYPEWVRLNTVLDPSGGVAGYVGVFSDVTFRRRAEEELVRQATTDPLTGLVNRALFQRLLVSGIERAVRYGRLFCVLFVDLDGFKKVNDDMGHEAGDVLLKEVARRLRRAVRSSDEVARLGGDEFTVLLSEVRTAEDAETVATKVVDALAEPYTVQGATIPVSGSVGIALCPDDGTDADTVMRAADEAMYAAKRAGRSVWRRAGRPETVPAADGVAERPQELGRNNG